MLLADAGLELSDTAAMLVEPKLSVDLPEGWQWKGSAPPERVELEDELNGTWVLGPDE